MAVSICDRRYVRLKCSHKPSKLSLHNGTGYCQRCRCWEFIDNQMTNRLLTLARQGQEGKRKRRR